MTENAMLAIAIASVAGCTAVGSYSSNKAQEAKYPGTACVERAWSHADRIECVKAQIVVLKPEGK
jgi:hypothetical protein